METPTPPSPPMDLAALVAMAAEAPTEWRPRIYVQRRLATGAAGASLGTVELTVGTDVDAIRREIARRAGPAEPIADVLCRALGTDGKKHTTWVRDEIDVQAYAPTADVAGAIVTELRAELAQLKAQLMAAQQPKAQALVASDPFSLAAQIAGLQQQSEDRLLRLLERTKPTAPPTTPDGMGREYWIEHGKTIAGATAGPAAWAPVISALAPTLEKVLAIADKVADARITESETRLATAAAKAGVELQLVPATKSAP